MFETTELFRAGADGFVQHRIPVVCVTARGTVLVFSEARRTDSDWGEIDILMRRSVDGGAAFDGARKVAEWDGEVIRDPWMLRHGNTAREGRTYSNCVCIADRDGRVHLLYCIEYRHVIYRASGDDALSWSAPQEITGAVDALHETYPWRVAATGPGHGLQTRSGRILTPIWLARGSEGPGGDHRPSVVTSLYSDDGGQSWRCGDIAADETEPAKNPNETVAVELPDGRILFNMRNESSPPNRRLIAFSPDGASNWSTPAFDPALFEPVCHAGLTREGGDLFFSNPNPLEKSPDLPLKVGMPRRNLVVRMSSDSGRTWPISRTIEPGSAGYSDMNALPDGTLLCDYEVGSTPDSPWANQRHILARFDREWLVGGTATP